jgi:hypothetical protein
MGGVLIMSIREAAECLRDQACTHYPHSEFARKYGGFSDPWLPVISSPVEVIAAPFVTCGEPG